MGEQKSLLLRVKENIVAISAIVVAIAALVVMPINFDSRYAHAGDMKVMQETASKQTQALKASITQQNLNWLEYYNDRITRLTRELERATGQAATNLARELEDVKSRKHYLEKSLVDQSVNR